MLSKDCLDKCSKDATSTNHRLRIKESVYITWLKPNLNSRISKTK